MGTLSTRHRNRFTCAQLEAVEAVLRRVSGKWLHHPLEEIKSLSQEGLEQEVSAFLNCLFQLSPENNRKSSRHADPKKP